MKPDKITVSLLSCAVLLAAIHYSAKARTNELSDACAEPPASETTVSKVGKKTV